MTCERGQCPPVALSLLSILDTVIETIVIVLVDNVTKGADNFHIGLGDVVHGELGIFKCSVDF